MFANQNSATRLRNRFTLNELTTEFGLDDDGAADSDKIGAGGTGRPHAPVAMASPFGPGLAV